ncbi:MAG TPA: hypothetical protein VEA92_01385 [Candidatus Paceibacterota bacterium]|nr:hypothetical protein [Candidatus Paceibacterota bacterium]
MEVVVEAIKETAVTDKGEMLVDFTPLTGTSAHIARRMIVLCEEVRERARIEERRDIKGEALYLLVREMAYKLPVPFPQKRAYHLIGMAYYRVIKRFVRSVREKRKEIVALRTQQLAAHNQQRLAETISL